MVTHTPIPHWLSLPLAGLFEWARVVADIQAEETRAGG